MPGFPPLPDTETLIEETNAIATVFGMDQIDPGMDTFIAALVLIIQEACTGPCTCDTCNQLRNLGTNLFTSMGAM